MVDVDWNNDGAFEADEGSRLRGLTVTRGRDGMVAADGNGFQRPQVGKGVLTLDNHDGRYDPLYSGSAIYPNVLPGREMRVRVNDGSNTYGIIRGKIQDVIPMGTDRRGEMAQLVMVDGWQWLDDRVITVATVAGPLTTDTALASVLTAADWPSAWGSSLGAGSDTLNWFWADRTAAEEILDLVDSEQGQFYIAADGQARFVGRHSLFGAASSVSLTQSDILKQILLPQPWASVRNIARVVVRPRVTQTSGPLWTLQDTPLVSPGESLTVFATYQYDNRDVPGYNVISPVATLDYIANTQADGLGFDVTANFTITTFTNYGKRAKIVIQNTGASAGYVVFLQVRGEAIDAPDVSVVESDGSSGSAFGPRTLTVDSIWQQGINSAYDFALWLRSLLEDPLAFPVIALEERPSLQFGYDLFTRVGLSVAARGISADYYIGKIQHEFQFESGQGVRTTWSLEPADMTAYWRFTTQIGVSSRFAY